MQSNGSNRNSANLEHRWTPLCNIGASTTLVLVVLLSGCGKAADPEAAKRNALVAARLEAIRQAGQPVALEELNAWYAEPPAGENAALLYAEAFAALPAGDAKSTSNLASYQQPLGLLHKAAAKGQCRYPVDLAQFPQCPLPHLAKIKTGCQLLGREALAYASKGQTDLAAQSLLDELRVARSLEQEPLRVSQLSRMACDTAALGVLEAALDLRAFPEQRLQQLQAMLHAESSTLVQGLTRTLVAERCSIVRLFQMTPQEYESLSGVLGTNAPFGAAADREKCRKSAAFNIDLLLCLDYFSNALAMASLPFPACLEAADQCAPDSNPQITEARSKSCRICAQFMPELVHMVGRTSETIAQLRVAEAAVAVERYRAANSSALPISLNQLMPQYLAAMPEDPFDGKPLRFHRLSPKGFVIYSIGVDRQDNGGTPKRAAKGEHGYDLTFCVHR